MTDLAIPAAAAARLAAGEVVRVWVEMERQPPANAPAEIHADWMSWDPDDRWFGFYDEEDNQFRAPAASGDRVEVECPECGGEAFWFENRGPFVDPEQHCERCYPTGRLAARVLADPVPGQWCEECEGGGTVAHTLRHLSGSQTIAQGWSDQDLKQPCPTCHGTPPWGWWYELGPEGDR